MVLVLKKIKAKFDTSLFTPEEFISEEVLNKLVPS